MSTRTETPTARPPVAGAKGARILIVASPYYADIADALVSGARREIEKNGAIAELIHVPGAFEIPGAIALAAAKKGRKYDGYVALGCVIRGETYHFEIVAGESSRAIMDLTVDEGFAIGNGILTVEDEEQAIVRADPAQGDKGGDAARAALALHGLKQTYKAR